MEEIDEYDLHADFFEDNIPDDALCVSVKMMLTSEHLEDVSGNSIMMRHDVNTVRRFLTEKYFQNLTIYAYTCGLHLNGKSKKPHIHLHMIVDNFEPPSNVSRDKKVWGNKNDTDMSLYSFKFQKLDVDAPKFQFLAYPLKEKKQVLPKKDHYFLLGEPMSFEYIRFLENVGNDIYSRAYAIKLRVEKSDQKKIHKLQLLKELCEQNRDKFSTYREMMKWLDVAFIHTLKVEEKPNPKNYKDMCFIVANTLGLVEYSDVCMF